jgi:DNA-binding response OmpR family regulator
MQKVLIIDDDHDNLQLMAEMIQADFEPVTAANPLEGLRMAVQTQPGVILLDVNMPGMDGFEVCRRLREQPSTRHIPVLMVTHQNGVEARVRGLETGADDYIGKPFQVRELIARIKARLRRLDDEQRRDAEIALGNLRLIPKSFQVLVDGEQIRLTQLEFDLLRYFLEHPNEVIDRRRLLGDLWPDAIVADRTVDTHVANLRKKIRSFTDPIQTIYGAGYMLRMMER